jgi:hypothetical protein
VHLKRNLLSTDWMFVIALVSMILIVVLAVVFLG